jgi:hypothetical protein
MTRVQNSATFFSKFSQIKKWIYKIFGTLKNNLIYAQVAKVLQYILCIVPTIWDMKKHKKTLFYSIPFHSTKMSSTWSMSITLVVTITNRPSQGSHNKPVLIIITIARIFKRHTWIYKNSKALWYMVLQTGCACNNHVSGDGVCFIYLFN